MIGKFIGKKSYLLEGFNFDDGLGIESGEAVPDGFWASTA